MYKQNLEVLKELFNWQEISEISVERIQEMSEKLGYPLNFEIQIKSTWGYYKKFTILSLDKTSRKNTMEPIFFLKYVREHFFSEILGFHLTYNYFDRELCANGYLAGLYQKKSFLRNQLIPYIFLRYVKGKSIDNYNIHEFKFQLGRMAYLHKLLSLYDVYDRHFIVRPDKSLCRIDFGRSFENLQKKYMGFKDFLKSNEINELDQEFQKGYNKEKEIIKRNLICKKNSFTKFIRSVKLLKQDHVVVSLIIERFVNRLIDHWSKIGFLNEMDITQIKWI